METVETIHTDKGTLRIHTDDMAESPFESCDTLGTIYHWHKRYNLGVEVASMDEVPKGIRLPVYLYDHSGITIRTGSFGDPWDSGQVGYIVVEHDKACKEYGCKKVTPTIREKILKVLNCEVETFARYLEGQVYGFTLEGPAEEPCPHCGHVGESEDLDSCWGFIGHLDEVVEDMLWHIDAKRIEVAA